MINFNTITDSLNALIIFPGALHAHINNNGKSTNFEAHYVMFSHPLVSSSHFGPNNLLDTLFSGIFNFYFFPLHGRPSFIPKKKNR